MTEEIKPQKILKVQCTTCKIDTNHRIEWEQTFHDENDDIWVDTTYQLLLCQGCDTATLKSRTICSEDMYQVGENEYDFEEKIIYYPKRSNRMISPILNSYHAPPKVRKIYLETVDAYNNEQQILCAIGIRAIIEAICLEENIVESDLKKQIEGLINNGIVTKKLGEGLQENRLLGNESAHELASFRDYELLAGINLMEAVIENHYAINEKIETLKSRKPKK